MGRSDQSNRHQLPGAVVAAVGAGFVHAASARVFVEHPAVARLFVVVAVLEIAWAGIGALAPNRSVAAVGAVLGTVVVGATLRAATGDLVTVAPGSYDAVLGGAQLLAGVLAGVFGAGCMRGLLSGQSGGESPLAGRVLGTGCVAVALLGLVLSAGQKPTLTAPGDHDHDRATGFAAPFDPEAALDLSGVAGATPGQRSAAADLVRRTGVVDDRYGSTDVAVSGGFVSAGDAASGYEHFVHAGHLLDGASLDPERPEILVYEVDSQGRRTLALVEYALAPGSTLEEAPELGGPITVWEQRGALCLSGDTDAPDPDGVRFDAFAGADGRCGDGAAPVAQSPVLSVWVAANACGPFATLEKTLAAPDDDGKPTCGRGH